MTGDRALRDRAAEVLARCRSAGLTVATVESCTGGLLAGRLTGPPGSSAVVERGFVTYGNAAKTDLVGVPAALFPLVGAVSEEVARAMALGGLDRSRADVAVAVTGVAGPGASENKPAGLVHLAAARRGGGVLHRERRFAGDRAAVRRASVLEALEMIDALARDPPPGTAPVAGVDFSGARDAGRRIWIAEGRAAAGGVELVRLARADELAGGSAALEDALRALVAHVASLPGFTIGFDFPFGLPESLVREAGWRGFVRGFARRYPERVHAEKFRDDCRAAPGPERWRRTDREAKAPMTAYNQRLYLQTWAGIGRVLAPLVLGGRARALPFQKRAPDRPAVAEVCPASLLRRESLHGRSYKGGGAERRGARERILSALERRGALRAAGGLRRRVLDDEGGDALDAALACVAAARIGAPSPPAGPERIEGRIFF